MKIKGKGSTRMEQITCKVLIIVSVTSFALCFFIEYVFSIFVDTFWGEKLHIEFLKNVIMGISGSSFVSFICIIFPYLEKKHKFKNIMFSKINNIYISDIFIQVANIINEAKKPKKIFKYDYALNRRVNSYLDEIFDFVYEYLAADWYSKEFDTFVVLLLHIFIPTLQMVLYVDSSFLTIETTPNESEEKIIIRRAKKDIYDFVLNILTEFDSKKFRESKKFFYGNYTRFVFKNFLQNILDEVFLGDNVFGVWRKK